MRRAKDNIIEFKKIYLEMILSEYVSIDIKSWSIQVKNAVI